MNRKLKAIENLNRINTVKMRTEEQRISSNEEVVLITEFL